MTKLENEYIHDWFNLLQKAAKNKKKNIRKLSKLLREKMGCKMEKAKQAEKNVILVRLNIHKGEKLMATAQQTCYRFGALISGAFPGTCC